MIVTVTAPPVNEVTVSGDGPQGATGATGAALATLGTSFPVSPGLGQLFYNTDTATLYVWQGSSWAAI